ncbi:hypothetical protein [Actinoplanes sp. N902-109]|uniref:hypothetical protein n=1 Tax=Actinoplanes sp. (strain N902-109) TaxID=649831 RepID=UPI00032961AF|nr:hypothetical protein [Actinoplanes sp. N902-109]AGL20853.1 hypothetical protein L083_7343 [Actinoplanes sp. N902-109]
MHRFSKRSFAIGGTGLVVLGVAGAAWAAWNLSGSGDAQARAGSAVTLKVTSAGLAADGLTPGNPTTVLLTVENRNAFPVRITDVDLTQLASPTPGCDAAANVEIVDDAPLPQDATVPAGSADRPATARLAWAGPVRMVSDPADACQGASFTFTVHLDAVSAAA